MLFVALVLNMVLGIGILFLFQGEIMAILNYKNYVEDEVIATHMENAYNEFMAGKGGNAKSELEKAVELGEKASTDLPRCALMKMVYDDVLADLSDRIVKSSESVMASTPRVVSETDASAYTEIMLDATLIQVYAAQINTLCGSREFAW